MRENHEQFYIVATQDYERWSTRKYRRLKAASASSDAASWVRESSRISQALCTPVYFSIIAAGNKESPEKTISWIISPGVSWQDGNNEHRLPKESRHQLLSTEPATT